MTTRTFIKGIALVVGLLCATTFQAVAQQGGGRGRILDQDQMAKLNETIQGELAPLREKLVAAQKEALEAVLSDAGDDAVKAKLEAVGKIQTEMMVLRLKGLKAIKSSLTADQKALLKESPGGFNALFGMMPGGRGGRGGGRNRGGGGGGANN